MLLIGCAQRELVAVFDSRSLLSSALPVWRKSLSSDLRFFLLTGSIAPVEFFRSTSYESGVVS